MSGQQPKISSRGTNYENTVEFLLGQIANLVKVPREKDFGIDFYIQPRVSTGPMSETVTELGSLQVKGGQAQLRFGGLDGKGRWKEYEFAWLRSLSTPLHLARVDERLESVSLFSIWPMWLIFWKQQVSPFEIVFTLAPPGVTRPEDWQEPHASAVADAEGKGDGMKWTVNLGPPFLHITSEKLSDKSFSDLAVDILRFRIATDMRMLTFYQLFIPHLQNLTAWRTDSLEILALNTWQFWDSRPGVNVGRICETIAPALVNLGIHLQSQNDPAAYNLIPVLEWIAKRGLLDGIGKGLLEGLNQTRK